MKRGIVLAVLIALVAGCSDSTGPASPAEVSLSFSSTPATTSLLSRNGGTVQTQNDSMVISIATDILVLNRVEVVFQEVELRRVGVDTCEGDDCAQFESGPFLLDLSLAAGAEQIFAIDLDEGLFDIIEFDIHKVTSGGHTEEVAFLASYPDLEDLSIRVHGSFNGTPFLFTSDLNEEQELNLAQPLAISGPNSSTNLTVVLDVTAWFVDESGDLIDPASANKGERNEDLVESNIRQAFEGFKDDNRDGQDDDSHGGV